MRISLLAPLALAALLTSCEKPYEPKPTTFFGKDWYSTYQVGEDGHTIFSTTGPKVPMRIDGFRLDESGGFLEFGLDAILLPEGWQGTWKSESSQSFRVTFSDPARKGYLLRITKPTNTQLQVRRDY